MQDNQNNRSDKEQTPSREKQDIDKAPGEGVGQGETVTTDDLKGKKIDADPEKESDKPAR